LLVAVAVLVTVETLLVQAKLVAVMVHQALAVVEQHQETLVLAVVAVN
jgi:hypothetical protein